MSFLQTIAMGQEERDFLQKLCESILNADKTVRFAGVVDSGGKLLNGRYRADIPSPLIKANHDGKDPKATSFYSAYQALVTNKKFESDLGQIRFQVTEFDKVTLVSIPLTAQSDRFLCISIDAPTSHEKVIPKILDILG
ncbi:MAG TPA: hypothetical protein VLA68_07180 [Nitrososphaera sp.]|nr:hypothetical protein [Nitrososphaera sp.]